MPLFAIPSKPVRAPPGVPAGTDVVPATLSGPDGRNSLADGAFAAAFAFACASPALPSGLRNGIACGVADPAAADAFGTDARFTVCGVAESARALIALAETPTVDPGWSPAPAVPPIRIVTAALAAPTTASPAASRPRRRRNRYVNRLPSLPYRVQMSVGRGAACPTWPADSGVRARRSQGATLSRGIGDTSLARVIALDTAGAQFGLPSARGAHTVRLQMSTRRERRQSARLQRLPS